MPRCSWRTLVVCCLRVAESNGLVVFVVSTDENNERIACHCSRSARGSRCARRADTVARPWQPACRAHQTTLSVIKRGC